MVRNIIFKKCIPISQKGLKEHGWIQKKATPSPRVRDLVPLEFGLWLKLAC